MQECSKSEVVDCVAEFLEAVIHCIVYQRGVYPASSFEDRQVYGLVVPRNRHPRVVEYISHAIEQIKIVLSEDDRLDVRVPIIYEENGMVREMYNIMVSPQGFTMTAENERGFWYRVYDDFRAVLLRLQSMSVSDMMTRLSQTQGDVTFRIQMCANGKIRDLLQGWMVVGRDREQPSKGKVIPLPTIHLPPVASPSLQSGDSCCLNCMIHVYNDDV